MKVGSGVAVEVGKGSGVLVVVADGTSVILANGARVGRFAVEAIGTADLPVQAESAATNATRRKMRRDGRK